MREQAWSQRLHEQVLVVDDDPDVRSMLVEVLAMQGYGTASADGGRSALDYLKRGHRPDLILLDLLMPDMNGWQFRAEQLQDARLAQIPVVLLSADTRATQKADLLGLSRGIRKPVDLDQLLEAVGAFRA